MLSNWQLKFNGTSNALDSATYTLASLINFMEQQHLYFDAKQDAKKKSPHFSYSSGTSDSHGGPVHPPPPPIFPWPLLRRMWSSPSITVMVLLLPMVLLIDPCPPGHHHNLYPSYGPNTTPYHFQGQQGCGG